MTPDDIGKLRTLHSQTSPGNWKVIEECIGHTVLSIDRGLAVCYAAPGSPLLDEKRANFAFIAKVHNLLPDILNELDRREELLADAARDAGKVTWDELPVVALRKKVERLTLALHMVVPVDANQTLLNIVKWALDDTPEPTPPQTS